MTLAPEGRKIIESMWPHGLDEDAYGRKAGVSLRRSRRVGEGGERAAQTAGSVTPLMQGLGGDALVGKFTEHSGQLAGVAGQMLNQAGSLALSSQNIFNTKTMLNAVADDYQAKWEALTAASISGGGIQATIQAAKAAVLAQAQAASGIVGSAFQSAHTEVTQAISAATDPKTPAMMVNSLIPGEMSKDMPPELADLVTQASSAGPSAVGGAPGALLNQLAGPVQQFLPAGMGPDALAGKGGLGELLGIGGDQVTTATSSDSGGQSSAGSDPLGRMLGLGGLGTGAGSDGGSDSVSRDDREVEDDDEDDEDEAPAVTQVSSDGDTATSSSAPVGAEGRDGLISTVSDGLPLGGASVEVTDHNVTATLTTPTDVYEATAGYLDEPATHTTSDAQAAAVPEAAQTHTTAAGVAEAPTATSAAGAAAPAAVGGGAAGSAGMGGMVPMGAMGAMGAMGQPQGQSGNPLSRQPVGPEGTKDAGGTLFDREGSPDRWAELADPDPEADAVVNLFSPEVARGVKVIAALMRDYAVSERATSVAVAVYSDGPDLICTSDGLGVVPEGVRYPEGTLPLYAHANIIERFRADWSGGDDPATVLSLAAQVGVIGEPEAIVSTPASGGAPLPAGVEVVSDEFVSKVTPAAVPSGDALSDVPEVGTEHIADVLNGMAQQWRVPGEVTEARAWEEMAARRWTAERNAEYIPTLAWWLVIAGSHAATVTQDYRFAARCAWVLLTLPVPVTA